MNDYRSYSKDIWDYLGDMPYMPTRADRDRLLSNNPSRVQLWDYFFRIKPEDVGKPQKAEIKEIEESLLQDISTHNQKQKEIAEAIRNNGRILFWKKVKNFLYGGVCFALTLYIYRVVTNNNLSMDWLIGCTSPFLVFGFIFWLMIPIVGWNEKREIGALKAQSRVLHEQHSQSTKAKVERKNFLKLEIKELKKQIPTPPLDIEVHQWFVEHLISVVEDSKRETGLLSGELIKIESDNPILVFGPGELQDPKRFPPTFSEIRATEDINFDIKKHLTARRAVELPGVGHDVLYGMYYLECILIAKDMLATYGLFYDFITNKSHGVETTEQYYNDVVSIVITNEFRWIERNNTQQVQTKEVYVEDAPTFMLSLASGESRTVTFVNERYFSEIRDKIDISEEEIPGIYLIRVSRVYADHAIKALRHQLRLHKGLDNGDN